MESSLFLPLGEIGIGKMWSCRLAIKHCADKKASSTTLSRRSSSPPQPPAAAVAAAVHSGRDGVPDSKRIKRRREGGSGRQRGTGRPSTGEKVSNGICDFFLSGRSTPEGMGMDVEGA